MNDDSALIAHWKLDGDCRDHAGVSHGENHGVAFSPDGALFDGRGAHILAPSARPLDFGADDFSISVHVHTDDVLDDIPGDILSKYDPDTRTGVNFGLANNAGVTAAQANYRHLHFGIDSGHTGEWIDCGRPGNNLRVYSLCVFEGNLYAGTFETGADESGGVYRYDGDAGWIDCGHPDRCNTMASLCGVQRHAVRGLVPVQGRRFRPTGVREPEPGRQHVQVRGRFRTGRPSAAWKAPIPAPEWPCTGAGSTQSPSTARAFSATTAMRSGVPAARRVDA